MTTTLIHDPTTNGGPPLLDLTPFDLVTSEIDDLYAEAKNWADGQPIDSEEMADAITKLHDAIHDAGKRAEEMRVAEKKPLDEAVAAVQSKYNPYVQPKKGKVALAKESLQTLLTPWRQKKAAEAEAEAARRRQEAEKLAAAAQEAIRSSSGNLEAREAAEALLTDAKDASKWAKRAEKAATTGTGLRTVWVATMTDSAAALDWAYGRDPQAFTDLVQGMANSAVHGGARSIPGFDIQETKVAT